MLDNPTLQLIIVLVLVAALLLPYIQQFYRARRDEFTPEMQAAIDTLFAIAAQLVREVEQLHPEMEGDEKYRYVLEKLLATKAAQYVLDHLPDEAQDLIRAAIEGHVFGLPIFPTDGAAGA